MLKQIVNLPQSFWILNLIQMMERLAFWVVVLQLPIYIAQKDAVGGLHWDQAIKAVIFFWWALIQRITPIFTGGFADRFGSRNALALSFAVSSMGYIIMAYGRDFISFLTGALVLGFGLGIFQPALQGGIARTLSEKNSSVGWGVNVVMINSAVFIGVPLSIALKDVSWQAVFIGSGIVIALNYIILIFYKEHKSNWAKTYKVSRIFRNIFVNFSNPKIYTLILLMSGFTMIYMQFYETLPNFIVDWIDSGGIAESLGLPGFMLRENAGRIMIAYEWFYNINTGLIVVCVVFVSWLLSKYRKTSVLMIGILLVTFGFALCGISMSGELMIAGFVLYTFGEMISNPKFNEYMGRIAPDEDKALFMGYINISWAIGLSGGALLGGWLYREFGEKSGLAIKYLAENFDIKNIDHSTAFDMLTEITGLNPAEATGILWNTYQPWLLWVPFVALGIAASIGMYFYSRKYS